MTGKEFGRMRRAYGLTSSRIAEILGVSMSTVYRWEQTGEAPAPVDPGTARFIHVMADLMDEQGTVPEKVTRRIQQSPGGLLTLYVILGEYFNRGVPGILTREHE